MLSIYLFGQLRAEYDEQPLKLPRLPKTLPLWAFLLLRRREPIERETLAFTLWPDETETRARVNLRRHLQELRRVLPPAVPPWILADAQTVQWNPAAPYWLDLAEFEGLGSSLDELGRAVDLYAGDLLENLYEDWLYYDRERLRGVYFSKLSQLVALCRERRDLDTAIHYAQLLIARDPLREDSVRQLMALRYQVGDRSGALHDYDLFTRRLRDELDVAPMPETVMLRDVIIRNAPQPAVASVPLVTRETGGSARVAPPPELTLPFVGREAELQVMRDGWGRASRGHGHLVLLSGETGIGKTTTTNQLVRQVEREGARILMGHTTFAEPLPYQAIVEALRAGLPLISALQVKPLWLSVLSTLLPELRERQPAQRLPQVSPLEPEHERLRLFEAIASCLEALAHVRPLLLILEDLHWAGGATVALLEFLARRVSQHPLLIVGTYREDEASHGHPLREMRRRLRHERLLTPLALGPLSAAEVAQFVAAVPALEPDSGLAADLYAQSEGHPFFLRELVHEQIESGVREDISRAPRGVQELIRERAARLSPDAQALAAVCAVIGGACEVELTCEVGGWSEAEALVAFGELLDRQLMRSLGGRRRGDYAFSHQLIQSAIYDDLAPDERRRIHRRAAEVMEGLYVERLDELAAELGAHWEQGGEPERASQSYLRAAERALSLQAEAEAMNYVERILRLSQNPMPRFQALELREGIRGRQGAREEQRADLAQMQELAAALDTEARRRLLLSRILFHRALGERETEGELIALLNAEGAQDRRWHALALYQQAVWQISMAHYDAARLSLDQASALAEHAGDARRIAECHALHAETLALQGNFAEAQALLQRATSGTGALANPALLVHTLRSAAVAALSQLKLEDAYSLATQLLETCRSLGDREGEADAHARIATAAARLFRVNEARAHYTEAEQLYARLGIRKGQAAVLLNSAMLLANLGQYEQAIAQDRKAQEIFALLNDPRGQTISLINLAWPAMQTYAYTTAKQAAEHGLELARQMQSRLLESYALANLGAAERELGELDPAIAHMQQGIALRRQLELPIELANDLCDLALAFIYKGDLGRAQQAAEEMLKLYDQDPEHMTYPARMLWVAAQVYRAAGKQDRARQLLADAHSVLEHKATSIPDLQSRQSFLETPSHQALAAAFVNGEWSLHPSFSHSA